MKTVKFWKPIVISIAFTPIALFTGFVSAGAGHGDYFWVRVLFPYTMLSTLHYRSITEPFLWLTVIQFPVYGLILAVFSSGRKFVFSAIVLTVFHFAPVILSFILVGENF